MREFVTKLIHSTSSDSRKLATGDQVCQSLNRCRIERLIIGGLLVCITMPTTLFAWGEPHIAITKAAIAVLQAWERELLGAELEQLANNYCLIPDRVYTDAENAKYATMSTRPGEIYLRRLHLPEPEQTANLETLHYFMDQAVTSLRQGNISDGARFMGTLCHVLQDYSSPAHTIPGDNMFTLTQQFIPPSGRMKGVLLHGPIENGSFNVSIDDYQPRLLGTTVEEASWHLLHRVHEVIINARRTTFPIIHALNDGNDEEKTKWQKRTATFDARVVADTVHTILCLAARKFDPPAEAQLHSVDISELWPLEAVNLFYPQSQFFGMPHWGHACSGIVLKGGTEELPILLRVVENEKTVEKKFADGISSGIGRPLTWLLPRNTYRRFTVLVGLQAHIGDKGRVEFAVLGDNRSLETVTLSGTDTAHDFNVDITGVSQLRLTATNRGGDAKSNYAVWALPTLHK